MKNKLLDAVNTFLNFLYTLVLNPIVHLFIVVGDEVKSENTLEERIKDVSEIPGPKGWPILGDILQFNKSGGAPNFPKYIKELHEKYGHIVRVQLGPEKYIFVSDPAIIREIIRTEPLRPYTQKLPARELFQKLHPGKRGLFFQNGESWHEGRTLLTKVLLKDTGELFKTTFEICQVHIQRKISEWKLQSKSNDGKILNLEADCYDVFMKTMFTLCFGKNWESYIQKAGYNWEEIINNQLELLQATDDVKNVPAGLARAFGLQSWKRYEELTLKNLEIGQKCSDLALAEMREDADQSTLEKFGLVHRFKQVANASDEDIRIHCTDFAVDVNDPTSITMLFSVLALGRNPIVQEKILEEIQGLNMTDDVLKYDDFAKLEYLKATAKEIIRKYPVSLISGRYIVEDRILGGYRIPAGHFLELSSVVSQNSEEWFPNADKLSPERWMIPETDRESGQSVKAKAVYKPFGHGSRTCPGKNLALIIQKTLIVSLVQHFTVESEDFGTKLKFVYYPDGDFSNLKMIPRNKL